jgi:hypothetical protein
MPGLENGSSLANAFTWDPTAYPGGTRVFGATSYNQSQDWWALYLLAGKTYVFQSRLPTTWSHYLYLYDSNGSYLAGSSSGGDDGYPLSKLTYTPQKEGWYYLTIYGYYYYGYYGPYVLESVPAPKSFRTFCFSPSRLSARSVTSAVVPSRFDVIRERTQAAQLARYTMCAKTARVNGSRLAVRSVQQRQTAARFNTIKTPTVLVVPGGFAAPQPMGRTLPGDGGSDRPVQQPSPRRGRFSRPTPGADAVRLGDLGTRYVNGSVHPAGLPACGHPGRATSRRAAG